MKREKLVSVRDRVAELVAQHGSYTAAAKALGISIGNFHNLGTGKWKAGPKALKLIGLKEPTVFNRA